MYVHLRAYGFLFFRYSPYTITNTTEHVRVRVCVCLHVSCYYNIQVGPQRKLDPTDIRWGWWCLGGVASTDMLLSKGQAVEKYFIGLAVGCLVNCMACLNA